MRPTIEDGITGHYNNKCIRIKVGAYSPLTSFSKWNFSTV